MDTDTPGGLEREPEPGAGFSAEDDFTAMARGLVLELAKEKKEQQASVRAAARKPAATFARLRRVVQTAALALLAAFAATTYSGHGPLAPPRYELSHDELTTAGQALVAQLERTRNNTGSYPPDLEALVGESEDWHYQRTSPTHYLLTLAHDGDSISWDSSDVAHAASTATQPRATSPR